MAKLVHSSYNRAVAHGCWHRHGEATVACTCILGS